MTLKPNQSHYVLNALITRGRIRPAQVQAVLKERDREIASLRERLASLERLDGDSKRVAPRGKGRRGRPSGRRPPTMTPKVRALRRLQGKYMGYVRRLKPAEKARVRAVREKQGIQAAIRVASSLVARSS
jgi:hypothetical protein